MKKNFNRTSRAVEQYARGQKENKGPKEHT